MESPIFIVGLHRTGSTLWHNIISMSPVVCRLTEIRFLAPRWWHKDVVHFIREQVGSLDVDTNVERMVEMFFSRKSFSGLEGAYWRFENYENIVDDLEFRKDFANRIKNSDRSLGSVFKALVEELARATGKSRSCVKFPVDINFIPKLFEWYPRCKIMHITRDPRAIAVSRTNDPSGTALRARRHPYLSLVIRKAAMLFSAFQYEWSSRIHEASRSLDGYKLYRYEDLLYDPERVIRDLCEFLNLEFVDGMLQPQIGVHEHQPSSITGSKRKELDKEAAWRWQKVIASSDNRLITMLTRRAMERLEYHPGRYRQTH